MENIVRSCDGKFAAPGYLATEQLVYPQSKVDENVRISNDILGRIGKLLPAQKT